MVDAELRVGASMLKVNGDTQPGHVWLCVFVTLYPSQYPNTVSQQYSIYQYTCTAVSLLVSQVSQPERGRPGAASHPENRLRGAATTPGVERFTQSLYERKCRTYHNNPIELEPAPLGYYDM